MGKKLEAKDAVMAESQQVLPASAVKVKSQTYSLCPAGREHEVLPASVLLDEIATHAGKGSREYLTIARHLVAGQKMKSATRTQWQQAYTHILKTPAQA